MQYIESCLNTISIYYNIALLIVAVPIFIKLFTIKSKKFYMKPWIFLFIGGAAYLVEEIIIALSGKMDIRGYVPGIVALIIITSFIYMVLLQKEYIQKIK